VEPDDDVDDVDDVDIFSLGQSVCACTQNFSCFIEKELAVLVIFFSIAAMAS
jgi:hypothetical protein